MARFILVLKGKRQDIVITRCSAAALSCDIGSEDAALFCSRLAAAAADVKAMFDDVGNGE